MGTLLKYICNNCNYSAEVSGGQDIGMLVKTNTVLCTKCEEVVDVQVDFMGEIKIKEFDLNKCPNCNSAKYIIKWDNMKRPCPKCNGKINDSKEIIIMWD